MLRAIRVQRFARLFLLLVDALANARRDRYTSPRISSRPAGPPRSRERNRTHGAHVLRDVFAAHAVAARGAANEMAVLVGERDAQAVDLQLGDVANRVGSAQPAPHALVEGAQFLFVVGVVERQHRGEVLDGGKASTGRPPTRCVGESGVTSSGCSASRRCSSRISASNSASESSGAAWT